MVTQYELAYAAIKEGPSVTESLRNYLWSATVKLIVVAAEQASIAIKAPSLAFGIAHALAETVNSYTELVLPYYGEDGTFSDSLKDQNRSHRLKSIITNTAGELSRMNMQRITAAAKLKLKEDPSLIIKKTPISVLHEELMAIHTVVPKELPGKDLLLESLNKKISHPDANPYREKIANVVAQSVAHSDREQHVDSNHMNTVILGNRQAALLWQTRLLLKAATRKVDGTYDTSLLSDWQFAPYNTMVASAYREGYKLNQSPIEGVSYALITMLQDHAECVSDKEWTKS